MPHSEPSSGLVPEAQWGSPIGVPISYGREKSGPRVCYWHTVTALTLTSTVFIGALLLLPRAQAAGFVGVDAQSNLVLNAGPGHNVTLAGDVVLVNGVTLQAVVASAALAASWSQVRWLKILLGPCSTSCACTSHVAARRRR